MGKERRAKRMAETVHVEAAVDSRAAKRRPQYVLENAGSVLRLSVRRGEAKVQLSRWALQAPLLAPKP